MKKRVFLIAIFAIVIIIIGLIITNKKKQEKYNYEITKVSEYNYYIYKDNGNSGVIDKTGKIIIDAKYEDIIIPNPEKDVFICYKDEKTEALNANGNTIFAEYEEVEPIKLRNVAKVNPYEKNTLIYSKDGMYGLIDFEGKIIAKNIYEKIENLQPTEGKFIVYKNGKYGAIDLKGNILVDTEYDNVISDGYYTKEDGYKKSGFIVSTKTSDGVKYGYISYNGKQILSNKYNEISRISKEDNKNIYLIASENGKYGFYKNSKKIIENEYQEINYDDNTNVLIINKNKKYGAASLEGKIIVNINYDDLTSNGIYLYAKKAGENKVYDNQGNVVNINFNRCIYETSNPDYRISTIVNNDITYYGIMDKNSNQLVEENYRYIEYAYGNYFIVSDDKGALGVINNNGRVVLDIKYSSVQKIKDKNIIQAIETSSKTSEFYSENMEKTAVMGNANIKSGEDYIIISNDNETIYLDNSGNVIKDTSNIKNTTFPETIGEYKKEQITIESVYYTKNRK